MHTCNTYFNCILHITRKPNYYFGGCTFFVQFSFCEVSLFLSPSPPSKPPPPSVTWIPDAELVPQLYRVSGSVSVLDRGLQVTRAHSHRHHTADAPTPSSCRPWRAPRAARAAGALDRCASSRSCSCAVSRASRASLTSNWRRRASRRSCSHAVSLFAPPLLVLQPRRHLRVAFRRALPLVAWWRHHRDRLECVLRARGDKGTRS